jgi:hypothetical protein
MSFDKFRCGLSRKLSKVVEVFQKRNKCLIHPVNESVSCNAKKRRITDQ